MLGESFNHTIDIWIKALDDYDFNQLCTKPAPGSWSLGQLIRHLIDDTDYYIKQMNLCLSTNDNATEEASPNGKTMFLNNGFPDEAIEGAPAHASIPQPGTKEQLQRSLQTLKDEINNTAGLISSFKGKTKHPGLGYFNAAEWFRFAEMHLRHHLRQKKRIDDFLKTGS